MPYNDYNELEMLGALGMLGTRRPGKPRVSGQATRFAREGYPRNESVLGLHSDSFQAIQDALSTRAALQDLQRRKVLSQFMQSMTGSLITPGEYNRMSKGFW
jgi:hypothetical protein